MKMVEDSCSPFSVGYASDLVAVVIMFNRLQICASYNQFRISTMVANDDRDYEYMLVSLEWWQMRLLGGLSVVPADRCCS